MTPPRSRLESGSFRLSDPRKILRRTDRSDAIADIVLGAIVGLFLAALLAGWL